MKRKSIQVTILSSLMAASLTANAKNEEAKGCRTIRWEQGHVYIINSSINQATHMILPTAASVDPVVGNKDLWLEEHAANHVFIKPTNNEFDEAKRSTLSYLGSNGKSYEFVLNRVKNSPDTCVIITEDGEMLNQSWKQLGASKNQFLALGKELENVKKQSVQWEKEKKQIISQQRKALDDYRSHIFTGYKWNSSNIVSVYDDGRWTYVRVKNDDKGVMSVQGEIANRPQSIQPKYDSVSKIYKIESIYDKLTLLYQDRKIIIKRVA